MRALVALALLLGAAPAAAQSNRIIFTCTTQASGAGLTATTQRYLDRLGDLRSGATRIDMPLAGAAGTLEASWDVVRGLPEVARGRYVFRLPASADGTWQLAALGKPLRFKDGVLTVAGKQFAPLLASGAPVALILTARDGRERARATLDRTAFDAALDLARQSDARALAQASNYRSCKASTGA